MAKSETLSETRQKFEEWAIPRSFLLTGQSDGNYAFPATDYAWQIWRQAYDVGRLQGLEEAGSKLEAIVQGAIAAEGMLSPCSICRPSDEYRHEENCPILDAERFLSEAVAIREKANG